MTRDQLLKAAMDLLAQRVLRVHLPAAPEPELIFRLRCAAGMVNWLALAPIGAELAGQSAGQLERPLLPVLAGAVAAAPTS